MLGQKLTGMEIDESGVVIMTFERGMIQFEGEDFDAYIEVSEIN
jgi:hypothetical protein